MRVHYLTELWILSSDIEQYVYIYHAVAVTVAINDDNDPITVAPIIVAPIIDAPC